MRIAMIGTRGVPARYGGFETAVEEIGARLVRMGDEVTVYGRNPGQVSGTWRGMRSVQVPALRRRTTETLSHSILSAADAIVRHRPDMAFVFNAANAPVIPALRAAGIPVAVNVDGLEHLRAKWRGVGAHYFRWAEGAAVRWADAVIADSRVIADHVRVEHGVEATYIPYGVTAGHVESALLGEWSLRPGHFVLAVARLEPENQIERIIRAYRDVPGDLPLVIVGGSPYSRDYRRVLQRLAAQDPRVRLLGPIFDQVLLDTLLSGCRLYVHGHSVGGTNPVLLRAAVVAPVAAFDSPFNREVLGYAAQCYWDGEQKLLDGIAHALGRPRAVVAGDLLSRRFNWDDIARGYRQLSRKLIRHSVGYVQDIANDSYCIVSPQRYGMDFTRDTVRGAG